WRWCWPTRFGKSSAATASTRSRRTTRRMSAPINQPSASSAQPGGSSTGRQRRAPANVVLVGLSGSGKTTVGRLLAKRLGWRFVDTDREIQREQGQTVQAIFREHGEPRFRAIEAAMVAEVCGRTHQVIATGG